MNYQVNPVSHKVKGVKKSFDKWEVREWVHCLVQAQKIKADPEKSAAVKRLAKEMAAEKKLEASTINNLAR